jgi:hypothetical protein
MTGKPILAREWLGKAIFSLRAEPARALAASRFDRSGLRN